ncbi:MAG: 50S ribosomal protein L4 [Candidatus Niyogibacteria bacterium]|nr:MAG: 50S ribosomal protein L4 [Candidatus Niyogibacteria bacterium]
MEVSVYNLKAEKVDTLELPEKIFALKWNADLVHQVIESMRSQSRKGLAQARGRGDVSGGGKKPWRQKGTGRARHGSTRSPIWVGGGVTHGPTNEKKYGRKINKKAKKKALFMILSKKMADQEMMIMDEVLLLESKTKKAREALTALGKIKGFEGLAKKGSKIIVAAKDRNTHLAFRNIYGVKTLEARNINPLDLLAVKYLILGQKDLLNLVKI